MQKILEITGGVTRRPEYRMARPVNLVINRGETIALCGPNGGGKSLLADIITEAHPLCLGVVRRYKDENASDAQSGSFVRSISFRDVYGASEPAYYQQRWNHGDEAVFPTVREVLEQHRPNTEAERQEIEDFYQAFGVDLLLDKRVNVLSSGELRRFQLARILRDCPQLLIIDNPFIGLDAAARLSLTAFLQKLAARLTLVVVVSRKEDIPSFVEKVIHVENREISPAQPYEEYVAKKKEVGEGDAACPAQPATGTEAFESGSGRPPVIEFKDITISYGHRKVLNGLNWTVNSGEHWAVTGENGAGKTTLLSLVCADNPAAYACNISLFGKKRGSGESIWDIKRHIGYVSPEMYSTYRKNISVMDVLASGLRDTIGLYSKYSEADAETCRKWLAAFGVEHFEDRMYQALSSGEQRLILLIRAFVKSPELLILDEPFHGLDNHFRALAMRMIDLYMAASPLRTLLIVTHYEEELPRCVDHRLKLVKNL